MTRDSERALERIEGGVLTDMLCGLGTIADALAEKNVGSSHIESIAIIAIEKARDRAPDRFTRPPMLSPQEQSEWLDREHEAVDEAEAKFAGIINYIVALRDGVEEEEG